MKRSREIRREIHIMAESVILSAAKDLAHRIERFLGGVYPERSERAQDDSRE